MKTRFILNFKSVEGQDLYLSTSLKNVGNTIETALPMQYVGKDTWAIELEIPYKKFDYHYILKDKRDNSVTEEWGIHHFSPVLKSKNHILHDSWNTPSMPEFNLSTLFFKNIFPEYEKVTTRALKKNTHRFEITFPLFDPNERLVILGDADGLGFWKEENAIFLNPQGDGKWSIDVDLSAENNYSAYKYAVYNTENQQISYYEEGENRWVAPNQLDEDFVIVSDNNFRQPADKRYRGSGVAIPVFSLRSEQDLGVGEFLDLIPFGKWCKNAGFSLIQLLPIHDTTVSHDWSDCYPYAAISVFALHPMYLCLEKLNYKLTHAELEKIYKAKEKLNQETGVSYEKVNAFKNDFIATYVQKHFKKLEKNKNFNEFIAENKEWLYPYTAFCALRDHFKTVDSNKWGKYKKISKSTLNKFFTKDSQFYAETLKFCYVQWQLHEQLSLAVKELHQMGIAIKGDLPIGVYRNSVETWANPELFHTNQQAGAPPDAFAVTGQNWAFPTYNWEKLKETNFEWWKKRLQFMQTYFDAYRIDHILGFFRIWEIPAEQVQGILGKFEPAIPFTLDELREKGVDLSIERLYKPYITQEILAKIFGEETDDIIEAFFVKNGETFNFKTEFNTQRKIEKALGYDNPKTTLLYDLIANVLFIKDDKNDEAFHPRFALFDTENYKSLPVGQQIILSQLHEDYFYHKQEFFWKEKGLEKLPALKQASQMLTCGEDLGMVPSVVPQVMNDLAILSLEVQRMPKIYGERFSHPANAPYLCVVSPSSHDTSTLRQWWRENKENTQFFYNNLMGHRGKAPEELSPELQEEILHQHLYSPAMLCVIPLQEFLGIDEQLRNPNEDDERINIPSVYPHKWKYRMHINIETLLKDEAFSNKLRKLHIDCKRA
ncbi:4-alpha-glucanotransferase [Ornithobacterium rhinotracheale]|uniref:4-alpha-glucanotransferase n=1 Tax=Ornithobacterium rhinotracheale TaxID=28251 RepID=UPI004035D83D